MLEGRGGNPQKRVQEGKLKKGREVVPPRCCLRKKPNPSTVEEGNASWGGRGKVPKVWKKTIFKSAEEKGQETRLS